jgi:hypothetical protein
MPHAAESRHGMHLKKLSAFSRAGYGRPYQAAVGQTRDEPWRESAITNEETHYRRH